MYDVAQAPLRQNAARAGIYWFANLTRRGALPDVALLNQYIALRAPRGSHLCRVPPLARVHLTCRAARLLSTFPSDRDVLTTKPGDPLLSLHNPVARAALAVQREPQGYAGLTRGPQGASFSPNLYGLNPYLKELSELKTRISFFLKLDHGKYCP